MCGKHIYGHGLIGEEKECNVFKVYHFDYRGSTVAITDMYGNVTDRFEYDTYGKMVSHVGDSFVIFGYNGRDGVVTDKNGLIYMRARYYSPDMKRFVNADIVPGKLSNAITLNRFAYANGNPVSLVDPFGLSPWSWFKNNIVNPVATFVEEKVVEPIKNLAKDARGTISDFNRKTADTLKKIGNDINNAATAIGDKTKQAVNCGINTVEKIYNFSNDMKDIIINNVDASAGLCIGMGLTYDGDIVGVEAITRMDIIGVQLKDGDIRIGHPGKSTINVTLPTDNPLIDVTLGPQNNTYENFGGDYREVEDTTYVDAGKSYGAAAAFVIGYHYDVSISYSGIVTDLVEYFQ